MALIHHVKQQEQANEELDPGQQYLLCSVLPALILLNLEEVRENPMIQFYQVSPSLKARHDPLKNLVFQGLTINALELEVALLL